MALSTPHISQALRNRKIENVICETDATPSQIITTCPSCVQGLSRMQPVLKVSGVSLVVKVAEKHLGPGWKRAFVSHVKSRGGIEKVLF